ncbi:uncharacterized protein CC84DRAFT_1179216 [Paraphaeosphaeria sporulosa]|uniref:Uncharacterized protein n=1 Tax=Paraphaeosphaeria sporulosa TaxID=1460663 RepID=A0A177C458_9PLEO|nr:uncharacterized protein CC84DRAFT_1179216 [Paraphaeosphaeria sporulosa]OAG02285.1 hypothetical protein CC84DRAFT_1179216 [Paraphaeosphaeria sporulosa]
MPVMFKALLSSLSRMASNEVASPWIDVGMEASLVPGSWDRRLIKVYDDVMWEPSCISLASFPGLTPGTIMHRDLSCGKLSRFFDSSIVGSIFRVALEDAALAHAYSMYKYWRVFEVASRTLNENSPSSMFAIIIAKLRPPEAGPSIGRRLRKLGPAGKAVYLRLIFLMAKFNSRKYQSCVANMRGRVTGERPDAADIIGSAPAHN